MEGSHKPRKHNGGKVEFDSIAGVNGTGAIATIKQTRTHNGLGQHLDTRCVKKYKGQQLEFSAQVKLVISGSTTAVNYGPNKKVPEWFIKKYYDHNANKEQVKLMDKDNLVEGV
eukprot:31862-Ditylum_brightwellii.AAC.1